MASICWTRPVDLFRSCCRRTRSSTTCVGQPIAGTSSSAFSTARSTAPTAMHNPEFTGSTPAAGRARSRAGARNSQEPSPATRRFRMAAWPQLGGLAPRCRSTSNRVRALSSRGSRGRPVRTKSSPPRRGRRGLSLCSRPCSGQLKCMWLIAWRTSRTLGRLPHSTGCSRSAFCPKASPTVGRRTTARL